MAADGTNDLNDFDFAQGLWYEPHNNSGDNNAADLWFTAYDSDDEDGMCQGDGPPTCVLDCPDLFEAIEAEDDMVFCQWIIDTIELGQNHSLSKRNLH